MKKALKIVLLVLVVAVAGVLALAATKPDNFSVQRSTSIKATPAWAMNGSSPYITKVIQVFCDMDGMIGKQFEAGLADLKAVAEKP